MQELQPSQGCVLANSAAKTIPKPKRKSESKSELEPHLLPLSLPADPPELFSRVNMSEQKNLEAKG